jgi:multimeric flavodoxin WrbA
MNVLGIYGSPRKGGNTDILLEELLKGAAEAGNQVSSLRCCDFRIEGCLECGGCDETGECVINDDMQIIYPQLLDAQVIILASPIFFYSVTAQAKALIDRCQAMWCKRSVQSKTAGASVQQGVGYLVSVGATKGANLFEGAKLVSKYFFDALGMKFGGGLFFPSVEGREHIRQHPDALKQAHDLGTKLGSIT